jgi:hypothetical protein
MCWMPSATRLVDFVTNQSEVLPAYAVVTNCNLCDMLPVYKGEMALLT